MHEITWGECSERAWAGLGLSLDELKYLEVESRKGTWHKKGEEGASETEERISECVVIKTMKENTVRKDWSTILSEKSS